jgi:signal transduction histidine kinase/CHASE3 domain sensor protein
MTVLLTLVAILVIVGAYTSFLGSQAYYNIQAATDLLLNERDATSFLIDMESGTRGYIITGDAQFLQPYDKAVSQLPGIWSKLSVQISQLSEDAAVKSELDGLVTTAKTDAQRWQSSWAEKEIELRGSNQAPQAMSPDANLLGKQLFDALRQSTQHLDSALNDRMRRYSFDLNSIRQTELVLLVGIGVIALISGIFTFRVSRREALLQEATTRQVESERQRLQAVIDNLPVGVRLVRTPDSQVILQNDLAEELFPAETWNGMTRQERIDYFKMSKPDGTLLSPGEAPVARAIASGTTVHEIEFSIESTKSEGRPGGRRRHLLASASPIRDGLGAITAVVVVMQDVTRLREIDQRKDEFIATAAHELRNPLAALSGYNQLIQRVISKGIANQPMIERNVGEMSRQIMRLNNLVERLLDASRIQLGRLILDRSTQDLVVIARMVVEDLKAADGNAHNIVLTAPEALTGCWDGVRLEQVMTNLVGNALRHTPANSKVEVILQKKGSHARVEVIDEGPGIPPEQRPHLFDRYYQTTTLTPSMIPDERPPAGDDQTTGTDVRSNVPQRRQGLGLGLYISHEIVRAHKGQIGVDPNPEGGSIFWFTLPLGDC